MTSHQLNKKLKKKKSRFSSTLNEWGNHWKEGDGSFHKVTVKVMNFVSDTFILKTTA